MFIPFFGVFGACSTFVESMCLASVFVDSKAAKNIVCAASSHFCSAEKQFRFPLELGNQRPPTAQWTVTGSGSTIISEEGNGPFITHITPGKIVDMGIKDANNMGAAMAPAAFDTLITHFAQWTVTGSGSTIISEEGNGPFITHITPGKIVDMGIKDANNMGAAMAPAAFDTLITHFQDTNRAPSYYDAIVTGDLGYVGSDILQDLCKNKGYNINNLHNDCGKLIFDKQNQDTHSGGSGCACIATVFSGYFYKLLQDKKINKLLLIATGALMNSTSSQQGESIPGIAHAISIENSKI